MALGIYKPGQGYWVRVLTAVGLGALVLACAAWVWSQAGAVRLPAASHSVAVSAAQGDLAVGDAVTYVRPSETDDFGAPEPFGVAIVESYAPRSDRSGTIVLSNFSDLPDFDNNTARDEGTGATALTTPGGFSASVQSATEIPAFPPEYLQAGAAGVVLVLGFIFIYWASGIGRKPNEFLIAVDGEMKKVNWTSWKEVRGSTVVVIVAALLVAAILFSIDWVFATFFRWIDVLQT